jgi:hypothetical protein
MHCQATIAAAILSLTAATGTTWAATSILTTSSFDTNQDGWSIRDVTTNASYAASWLPYGGKPAGHIMHEDSAPSSLEVFQAGANFLVNAHTLNNDFSEAETSGGGVSFNWRTSTTSVNSMVEVSLWSNAVRLYASDSAAVGAWQTYDFTFDSTTAWMVDYGSGGQVATSMDMNAVLSNLSGMDISVDTLLTASGKTYLDNPTIYSVPAPGGLALIGLAFAGKRRRRR